MVICLVQGADLHMAQLMPLSLALVNPDWFYLSVTGSPRLTVIERVFLLLLFR